MKAVLHIPYALTRTLVCMLLLGMMLLPKTVLGQQEPIYSQFMYNKLPINPAYAGVKELWSLRLLYRDQWSGLKGHPRTMGFSANGPVFNDNIALGGNIVHDEIGLTRNTWITSSYAYRLQVKPGGKQQMSFSMGIHAGVMLYKANLHEVRPVEDNDPVFREPISRVLPEIGAGFYFTGTHFYAGASVPNFVPSDLYNKQDARDLPDNMITKRVPHFFVMAGGIVPIGKEAMVKFRPQVMTRNVLSRDRKSPFEMDINGSIMLYDWVNLGLTYRTALGNRKLNGGEKLTNPESLIGMVEFWPTKRMMIGYSFDYTLGELQQYSRGSHEIILGYDLEPNRKKGKQVGCYHF